MPGTPPIALQGIYRVLQIANVPRPDLNLLLLGLDGCLLRIDAHLQSIIECLEVTFLIAERTGVQFLMVLRKVGVEFHKANGDDSCTLAGKARHSKGAFIGRPAEGRPPCPMRFSP